MDHTWTTSMIEAYLQAKRMGANEKEAIEAGLLMRGR
jgi:Kef-type K+ transport system membrane component KefB